MNEFQQKWADFYRPITDDIAVSLKLEAVSGDLEHVHLRMPLEPLIRQVSGMFSAASLFGLADVCGTWLVMQHTPPNKFPLLAQSSTNLVSNTNTGYAHALAKLVKLGRTLSVAHVVVSDDEGRTLATATNTMVVR